MFWEFKVWPVAVLSHWGRSKIGHHFVFLSWNVFLSIDNKFYTGNVLHYHVKKHMHIPENSRRYFTHAKKTKDGVLTFPFLALYMEDKILSNICVLICSCNIWSTNTKLTSWCITTVFPSYCWIWWHHEMETFPRYWPFVRGIHRSLLNSPHKCQ